MAFQRPSRKDLQALCADTGPGDGLDPRYERPGVNERRISKKTLQLNHQIHQCLATVLAGCGDETLRDLEVVSVAPAAGVGRVLVTLQPALSAGTPDLGRIEARLGAAAGMLRNEVASAIHRRKTPELILRVVLPA